MQIAERMCFSFSKFLILFQPKSMRKTPYSYATLTLPKSSNVPSHKVVSNKVVLSIKYIRYPSTIKLVTLMYGMVKLFKKVPQTLLVRALHDIEDGSLQRHGEGV